MRHYVCRSYTDCSPECRVIQAAQFTLALLLRGPAGDRGDEVELCWGRLLAMLGMRAVRA